MGVYIKGMEMPQSCILCELACLYRIHSSTSRSIYCPLIEIKNKSQIEEEITKAIVHKIIDNTTIAEDIYFDLRQKLHDAVENESQIKRGCANCEENGWC